MGDVCVFSRKRRFPDEKFEKWPKLFPELRLYVLKFCSKKTLYYYSLCSKDCNDEVQTFHLVEPYSITLSDSQYVPGVKFKFNFSRELLQHVMEVHFLDLGYNKHKFKIFKNNGEHHHINQDLIHDGNAFEVAWSYFTKRLESMHFDKIQHLHMKMAQWPRNVMTMDIIKNIPDLTIFLRKSMYKDAMKYIRDSESMKSLTIEGDQLIIPHQIFKFASFKNLKIFQSELLCQMKEQDFLEASHLTRLSLYSNLISDSAINAKIIHWYSGSSKEILEFKILAYYDERRRMDERVVCRNLPISKLDGFPTTFKLERSDGMCADIILELRSVDFKSYFKS